MRIANVMPPHGLLMLAAVAERAGFPATILDFFAHPLPEDQAVQAVLATRAGRHRLLGHHRRVHGRLPAGGRGSSRRAPSIPIVFGGPHPTSLWSRLLGEFPAVDIIVVGEGEETLVELLQADLVPSPDIAGLAYRGPEGERALHGAEARACATSTRLPYPAYEKLLGYPDSVSAADLQLPALAGHDLHHQPRLPVLVQLLRSFRVRQLVPRPQRASTWSTTWRSSRAATGSATSASTTTTSSWTGAGSRSSWTSCCSRDLGITFNCIGRPDHLDGELIRTLKRGGCWMINLGVESGDQDLIDQHRTRSDLDVVAQTVHRVREAGIRVKGLFMMGIPGETEETLARTVAYALRHPFSDVNLTKFTPFPGSPIYAGSSSTATSTRTGRR